MTKNKIDDMTDEELEDVLKNGNENLQADQSRKDEIDEALSNDAVIYTDKEDEINVDEQDFSSSESVNQSIVKEEIEVKSVKEQKRLDKQKAIETAKNMLNKGLDIELISECTGLDIKEIKKL